MHRVAFCANITAYIWVPRSHIKADSGDICLQLQHWGWTKTGGSQRTVPSQSSRSTSTRLIITNRYPVSNSDREAAEEGAQGVSLWSPHVYIHVSTPGLRTSDMDFFFWFYIFQVFSKGLLNYISSRLSTYHHIPALNSSLNKILLNVKTTHRIHFRGLGGSLFCYCIICSKPPSGSDALPPGAVRQANPHWYPSPQMTLLYCGEQHTLVPSRKSQTQTEASMSV